MCFLISGVVAYAAVAHGLLRRPPGRSTAPPPTVNLCGCVAFGAAAVAAYVVPSSGSVADVTVVNAATSLGALCFLVGAVLLLPTLRRAAPASGYTSRSPGPT